MDLSVVVPLFNEAESIDLLFQEIMGTLKSTPYTFELIFVDDGSTDQSLAILEKLSENNAELVVISFRKNFGQTAALSAGFDHASGDIIVTLDADLQNDPRDIPKLVEKLNEGYDVVNGWRFDRQDAFFSRRLPSMIANKIISIATKVKLHDYGCTLKAFRKEVTKNIRLYGEMHRFIPAVASGLGISIAEVKVNHRPRQYGTSKYGISRTIRVILDLITVKFLLSYATRPIHVFGLIGFVSGTVGFLLALLLTIQRQFFKIPLANRPLLLLAILLIFIGLQFVTLGLIAEIQARTYHESQNKPIYVVRKILTHGRPSE